jgi:potassium-transporting ATPase KdpC subunit
MFKEAIKQTKIAFLLMCLFTILTGILYPVVVTGLAQLLFPWQANGSLIEQDGKRVGSLLIGQSFTAENYFLSRPSATAPYPYNGGSSSGSNMGPTNPDFLEVIKTRVDSLKRIDPQNRLSIPVDLVTASGSGLDPEISPLAALYQVSRIARLRHIAEAEINVLIESQIKNRTFILMGEPRINVLLLNISLDNLRVKNGRTAAKS